MEFGIALLVELCILFGLTLIGVLNIVMISWLCPPPPSMDEEQNVQEEEGQHGSGSAALRKEINPQALAALPVQVYQKKVASAGSEEEAICAICLGNWKEGDLYKVLPQCNHRFHGDCIDGWLLKNPTCPLCRLELKLDSIDAMV